MEDQNMDNSDHFDNIYKERNRLKQEKLDIQNNIKSTIDNIDTQIRKLKNQLKTLENKKKEFIIEYNKECDNEDRIRGSTPIQKNQSNDNSNTHSKIQSSNTMKCNFDKSFPLSPKSRYNKDLSEMLDKLMTQKMNKIENKMRLQEKDIELANTRASTVCKIM
tara:strand:- start:117 stop:605 length:489 start_codon:yes stop_codon:yes gene_type:complete